MWLNVRKTYSAEQNISSSHLSKVFRFMQWLKYRSHYRLSYQLSSSGWFYVIPRTDEPPLLGPAGRHRPNIQPSWNLCHSVVNYYHWFQKFNIVTILSLIYDFVCLLLIFRIRNVVTINPIPTLNSKHPYLRFIIYL